ncbi:synaptotagmin-4 [Trichogramma pretiosum]|uniref:synaptotagmin-4 n=1 Tax=Trichogramma pretiosum TaxID=7493 RepID=UPI0006C9BF69|nr:synaptotagmin-4 [Trichogramma pretiosum]
MVAGIIEDGPLIQPVEAVSPTTLVAVCLSAAFLACAAAMTWWLCRRRRAEHVKLAGDKSLPPFRPPHRKPTAVKSPGSQGHYLKKSPSPTGPAKSPPGSAQTPSPTGAGPLNGILGQHHHHQHHHHHHARSSQGAISPLQTPTGELAGAAATMTSLVIENERDKAELENSEKAERSMDQVDGCNLSYAISANGNNGNGFGSRLGQLVFKLRYLVEQNALVVTVVACKDLPARGGGSGGGGNHSGGASSDPYVKLQLLPDKQHRTKTRVLRNTRDPVYDEDFTFFGISLAQLQKISLHFVVMSFDRYSRDDVIGEVVCALSQVPDLEIAQNQQLTLCREICPRSLKIQSQGRGELLVSLCWQPAASKLTVVVLKARNLPKMDVTGLADPYVKIYLLYNNQRIAKRKTHVKKRTLNPIFNESIVFEIPNGAEGLGKISLEFALLDWDRVTKNEVIGRLEIGGPKCQGSALNHWNEVCNSPKRQIADWHKLRE